MSFKLTEIFRISIPIDMTLTLSNLSKQVESGYIITLRRKQYMRLLMHAPISIKPIDKMYPISP